jgi:hypothetical protein
MIRPLGYALPCSHYWPAIIKIVRANKNCALTPLLVEQLFAKL